MRISIVGSGYVGLVTGACLAELGHDVLCVDVDPVKVRSINAGIPPIHERGLDVLLQRHAGHRLRAMTDLKAAVLATDLTMVAVGTPFDGHAIDLSQIKEAAAGIGRALKEKTDWHMVVIKSTVVPGTTDKVVLPILERESGKTLGSGGLEAKPGLASKPGFGLGMNPEFLTEGEAVENFLHPDRLVLGAVDEASLAALDELYRVFPEEGAPRGVQRIRTNCATAEMIKYTSNSLLATLISFSNEIANLCSTLGGVDPMDVVGAMRTSQYLRCQTDPESEMRTEAIGPIAGIAPIADFLIPGCGFGGSCLPKDIGALIAHGKSLGASMRVLEAVRDTNATQPARMTALLEKEIKREKEIGIEKGIEKGIENGNGLRGLPVAVLGLAFRPDTADLRESPALSIIRDLLARGARVTAYDPAVLPESPSGGGAPLEASVIASLFDGAVRLARSLEEAVAGARGIVLVTRWGEFARLSELIDPLADPPVVVDGRRMLDKSRFKHYAGIGLCNP